jgi:hypothetical protein
MQSKREILVKNQKNPKNLDYIPRAVLMGKTGNGKTTLYNQICETSNPAGTGKHSYSRKLTSNSNAKGDFNFQLMDTPGTKSSQEAKKHAWLLKKALTCLEQNTIFLFLKFENRFEHILEQYVGERKLIESFKNKIVLIITHSDVSENPNNDFRETCELFQDYCQNIIFYSKYSDSSQMANIMYSFMSNMQKEKLEISKEKFFLSFDFNSIQSEIKMNKAYRDFEDNIKTIDRDMKALVTDNYHKHEKYERDEFLQAANVEYINQLERQLDNFTESYGALMVDLDSYYLYFDLKKNIIEKCENFFDNFIKSNMSYNPNNPCDPRNLYKRCPHCKLVWYKVTGCNNVTCGTRLNHFYFDEINSAIFLGFDQTNTTLERFVFEKNNDGISYAKKKIKPARTDKLSAFSLFEDQIKININEIIPELNLIVKEVSEKIDLWNLKNWKKSEEGSEEVSKIRRSTRKELKHNIENPNHNILKCFMKIIVNTILTPNQAFRKYWNLTFEQMEKLLNDKRQFFYQKASYLFTKVSLDFIGNMIDDYYEQHSKRNLFDRIFGKAASKTVSKIDHNYLLDRIKKEVMLFMEILNFCSEIFRDFQEAQKKNSKVQGCHNDFNWDVEGSRLKDEEILEIYKVKTIDEVIEILRSKKFNDLNDKYFERIDDTIYTSSVI